MKPQHEKRRPVAGGGVSGIEDFVAQIDLDSTTGTCLGPAGGRPAWLNTIIINLAQVPSLVAAHIPPGTETPHPVVDLIEGAVQDAVEALLLTGGQL